MIPGTWWVMAAVAAGPHLPPPTSSVSDHAHVLASADHEALEILIADVERETTAEIAVVTIPSLEGEALEPYANALFNEWGVGKRGQNNGVLILVSIGDRKVRIETGYGVESVLPDGLCGEIIRQRMIPPFKHGQWGAGLLEGTRAVGRLLQGEPLPPPHRRPGSRNVARKVWGWLELIREGILIFFVLSVITALWVLDRQWRGRVHLVSRWMLWLASFVSVDDLGRRRGGWFGGGSGGFSGGGGFGGFSGGLGGGGGASGGW